MYLFLPFAAFYNSKKHVTGQNSEVALKLTCIEKKQNIWYCPSPGKKKHTHPPVKA